MKRTYVFIDAQNLHLGIKSLGWSLDYNKFIEHLRKTYKVDEVYMYFGYVREYDALYKSLKDYGYKLVFKDIVRIDNRVKGNIDILLTVDVIKKRNEYDKAMIISADGDFISLYEYLEKDLSKEWRIIVPNNKSYSTLLNKYYRRIIFLNGLKSILERND